MKRYPITLPIKKVRPVKAGKDALEKYEAKIAVRLAETLQGLENISAHFTVITLQGIQIAVVPGELFSTLGVPHSKKVSANFW